MKHETADGRNPFERDDPRGMTARQKIARDFGHYCQSLRLMRWRKVRRGTKRDDAGLPTSADFTRGNETVHLYRANLFDWRIAGEDAAEVISRMLATWIARKS